MRSETAEKILNENRESYDQMAVEFSATRAKFWEELAFLAEHATPGMHVLDIGCGNGRFYSLLEARNVTYTGLDNSAGLLKEARRLHPGVNFVEGDATACSFPDESFDIAFSFATIHHVPSRALRTKFITEAARILRPGGTLILTAWDLWQPAHFMKLMLSANPFSVYELGDIILTFGKKKHKRYLHAFTEKELCKLLKKNGFEIVGSDIIVRESGSGQKNFLVVAKRKNS